MQRLAERQGVQPVGGELVPRLFRLVHRRQDTADTFTIRLKPTDGIPLVCGPEIMTRFTAAALVERGVHPERVRVYLERNMRCGVGLCGHCQYRELFVCVDGPVLPYTRVADLPGVREL